LLEIAWVRYSPLTLHGRPLGRLLSQRANALRRFFMGTEYSQDSALADLVHEQWYEIPGRV